VPTSHNIMEKSGKAVVEIIGGEKSCAISQKQLVAGGHERFQVAIEAKAAPRVCNGPARRPMRSHTSNRTLHTSK